MVRQEEYATARAGGRAPRNAIPPRPTLASPLSARPVVDERKAGRRTAGSRRRPRAAGTAQHPKNKRHTHCTLGGNGSSHVLGGGSPASKKNNKKPSQTKHTSCSWCADETTSSTPSPLPAVIPPTDAHPPNGSQPQKGSMESRHLTLLPTKQGPFKQEMQGASPPPFPLRLESRRRVGLVDRVPCAAGARPSKRRHHEGGGDSARRRKNCRTRVRVCGDDDWWPRKKLMVPWSRCGCGRETGRARASARGSLRVGCRGRLRRRSRGAATPVQDPNNQVERTAC